MRPQLATRLGSTSRAILADTGSHIALARLHRLAP
jgi:hypothetical protein